MRTIIYLLIMISLVGCNKPEGEPKYIILKFILTDENGQDLFFGQNAKYNPKDVKVEYVREHNFDVDYDLYIPYERNHFSFSGPLPVVAEFTFLFEFIPERIDTICFKKVRTKQVTIFSRRLLWDTYYNRELICTDCDDFQAYTIIMK